MPLIARDPSGLLERIPELLSLAERDASLRRAIEKGRPHAVHRRLFYMRWLGKAGTDRGLIDTLLSKRRLFLEPISRAPTLFTMNSVGFRVYGDEDRDPDDGTHIKTHYGVFLFIPLIPFSSYLVLQSPDTPNAWSFIGKVPPKGWQWAYSRVLALAVLLLVGGGALRAVSAARFKEVSLINGLPVPVAVAVGKLAPVYVAAGQRAVVTSPVGTQAVVVSHGKQVVESGTLHVKRGADAVLWNVLGAGFVYREEVHYGNGGASKADNQVPTVWCGQSGIVVDSVDDLFVAPPRTVSTRKGSTPPARVHIDLYPDKDVTCPMYLVGVNRGPEAIRLASAVAEAADFSPEPTELAAGMMMRLADPEQALVFLTKALKDHDASVELHRLRQSALIEAGRRQEAVSVYQQRAAAHPESGDDAYLSARVLSGPNALAAVTEAQSKFPDHPFLLRSLLFVSVHAGDYRKAVAAADKLRKLDRKRWSDVVPLHAQALVGDGKPDQARVVVDEALKAGVSGNDRAELLTLALQLAVAEPPGRRASARASSQSTVDAILKTVGDGADQDGLRQRFAAQLAAGLAMTENDLAKLADGPAKTSLRIGLLARKSPAEAVSQLARLEPAKMGHLPVLPWAMLVGEAARAESGKAALAVLFPRSPFSPRIAQALAAYVRTGAGAEDIEELPLEVVAAMHFARSRALAGSERTALEARARREDLLRGPVFQAMAEWPR